MRQAILRRLNKLVMVRGALCWSASANSENLRDDRVWSGLSFLPYAEAVAEAERELVGRGASGATSLMGGLAGIVGERGHDITAPATDAARQWEGWGTALKPAWEPICLARKPLSEKTVAANVLRWGTGAINVDGCRIEATDQEPDARAQQARHGVSWL